MGESFHQTGMTVETSNWHDAQRYMIDVGFAGGCYGIEEDLVHYSVGEIGKASNMEPFQRCTLKEIPEHILKGARTAGVAVGKGVAKGGKALWGKIRGK